MRIFLAFLFASLLSASAAIPSFESFRGTNGVTLTTPGLLGNRRVVIDGTLLSTKAGLVVVSNLLRGLVVSGDNSVSNYNKTFTLSASNSLYSFITTATGAVTEASLNNASNVLRNLLVANDSFTSNFLRTLISSSDITTSNNLVTLSSNNVRVAAGANISVTPVGAGGVMTYTVDSVGGGGTGGGSVSQSPTNIPSATSFTVNAVWQISCVSLAHNATVVVSNLSLGQVDARLIVTNTGTFTMTFPQFTAGNWENQIVPALPPNRTATIIFSRPTTSVTNVLMRGQDASLAAAPPSVLGTNAAGTIITISNLFGFFTNNTFGVPTLAGYINELNFIGATGTVSGTRFTGSVPGTGGSGGGGGSESVETNITVSTTNNIVLDLNVANIFRIPVQTNWTYTLSNMASLTTWPLHTARVYWYQDTNGQRLLNNYYVDGGLFETNAADNLQPTTNANAVDIMDIIPAHYPTNAAVRWLRDLQPRTAAQSFSLSNSLAFWMVADDLTGLPDNTQVGRVTNRMASFLSLTNGAAGVIKSNSVVNGHAALYFDGVGYLVSELGTGWGEYVGAESATIFIVMRQRSTDHQNCVLQWIASGEQIDIYATYDDVLYWEMPNNGPSGSISAPQPVTWDDTWHVLELVRGSDTAQILVDGAVVGSGTPSANFTVGDSGVFWHLGSANGGGTAFNGDIAEVRIYNDAKSSSDRTTIRAALKATYNTP